MAKRILVMASGLLGLLMISMVVAFRWGVDPSEVTMVISGLFWLGVACLALTPAKKKVAKAPQGKGVQIKPRKPR